MDETRNKTNERFHCSEKKSRVRKDELFDINVNTVTVIELVLAVLELLVLGRF